MSNGRGSDFLALERDPEQLAEELVSKRKARELEKETERLNRERGDGRHTWPEPEPLIEPHDEEKPYPLDALPDVISAAVTEYRAYGQQPLSLIASSALAAASLSSQGLADVARDPRLVGPISLNFCIVAGSGERKTSADRHFTSEIRNRLDALETVGVDLGPLFDAARDFKLAPQLTIR